MCLQRPWPLKALLFIMAVSLVLTACAKVVRVDYQVPEKLDTDLAFVELQISLLENGPQRLKQTGRCEIILTPRVDFEAAMLELTAAGGFVVMPPAEFRKMKPQPGVLKDIEAHSRYQIPLPALKKNRPHKLMIPFQIKTSDYGYLTATLLSPQGMRTEYTNAVTLYSAARDGDIFYSQRSILDLDVQMLREKLEEQGVDQQTIEYEIKKLKRGKAKVNKHSKPGVKKTKNPNDGRSYNSITIQGTIRFTDSAGGTHPVRFCTVQIMDQEAAPPDQLVTTTETDANGFYSVTVDDNDGDGTGRDIYVIAQANGDTVQVEDYGANHNVATGDIWEIDSLPAIADVPDDTTQTIDLTATNNDASPQNVAFELYESMNTLSRYLPDLGEPLPAKLPIRYPRFGSTVASFSPTNVWIKIPSVKVHDWDVHHHEYSHYLQHIYNTADNPGGPHNSCNNLCTTKGSKDLGVRMAWAESWPTFFGTMAQTEMALAAMGIPNLGDTRYTCPANGLDYDLEAEVDGCTNGEGCERALMRIFWDLYDNVNDDADQGVSLSAQALWDVIKDNEPHTFSAFWNDLTTDKTEAQKISYGRICTRYGVAPEIDNPADAVVYAGGAAPMFQWDGQLECDTGGNARYSVRFYNDALTANLYASPWQSGSSFTPSADQINQIFVGPDATLQWLVAGKDLSAPETGVYHGETRTIIDNYDVPDRNPVDIILALDLSGSMTGTVPGSDMPIQKIQLLQQAAEVFIRTWAMHAIDGDRLGVIYFKTDTGSVAGTPPYLLDVAANADMIIADINGQVAQNCTAIGGAIQVGYNALTAGDNKKVIIVFSDGEQTKNPFIDEEGAPSWLKIRQVPAGGTVPFGGYWCGGDDLADDPEGNPIVPDGDTLEAHDIQIHTIGVGVAGADFEDLIERVASETDALHHFTSAPDEDLDIFFTNDLINSLKTGTLEIVKTDQGTLGRGETRRVSVPVNLAAKSFTVVLSWKGELNTEAVETLITLPGGIPAEPSKVDRGDFFAIYKFDLPYKGNDGIQRSHNGNWRITMTGRAAVDQIKYQATAIVDEPCFDYEFTFPRVCYGTGDQIVLQATLLQDQQPLRTTDSSVWVDVTAPAHSATNIKAKYLPKMFKGTATSAWDMHKAGPLGVQERMAALIQKEKKVAEMLNAKRSDKMRLYDDGKAIHGDIKAGDGIYANVYRATQIPGNYQLRLNIAAASDCGRVERTEVTSTLIGVRTFDAATSYVTVKAVSRDQYAILVRPQDRFGNLLGPGHGRDIQISCSSGRLKGDWLDRMDGTYQQLITVKPGDNPRINIQINGTSFVRTNLITLMNLDRIRAIKQNGSRGCGQTKK